MHKKLIFAIIALALCSCTSNQFVLSDNAALWQNIENKRENYKTDNTADSASVNTLLYCANDNILTTKQQLRNYKLIRKQVLTNTKQTKQCSKQIVARKTLKYNNNPKPKLYRKPLVTLNKSQKEYLEELAWVLLIILGGAAAGWLLGWLISLIFASGVGLSWAWVGALIGGGLGILFVFVIFVFLMIITNFGKYHG